MEQSKYSRTDREDRSITCSHALGLCLKCIAPSKEDFGRSPSIDLSQLEEAERILLLLGNILFWSSHWLGADQPCVSIPKCSHSTTWLHSLYAFRTWFKPSLPQDTFPTLIHTYCGWGVRTRYSMTLKTTRDFSATRALTWQGQVYE